MDLILEIIVWCALIWLASKFFLFYLYHLSLSLLLKLNVPLNNLIESTTTINIFIKEYKNEIPFFNYSNPVKHFYDQTNNTVTKLITRNKKRLTKEIIESKELMILLAQSTTRELDSDEKKKVKLFVFDFLKYMCNPMKR